MDISTKPPAGKAKCPEAAIVRIDFNRAKDILEPEPLRRMKECAEALPSILKSMKTPTREVGVTIVDDDAYDSYCVAAMLSRWSNIRFHLAIQEHLRTIEIPQGSEIILLDERMLGTKGKYVAKELREAGYGGLIIGTSKTDLQEYADLHFPGKGLMELSADVTREFVEVINAALAKLGVV